MLQNTRQRLIEAARSLFAERGYDGTTTAAIASSAGVAEGTIYRHFKDKKELLFACLEPVISEAFERNLAKAENGISLRELVENMVRERMRILRENRDIYRILFTQAQYDPEVRRLFFERALGPRAERIAAVIRNFRERGDLARVPNPLIISVGLQGMLWELINFLPDPEPDPEQLNRDLVEFILYGAAGKPNGGAAHN